MYCFHLIITILYTFNNIFRSDEKCLSYTARGECKVCFPGYLGIFCSHTCRYPNYGPGCQRVCHCNKKDCKPITGCSQTTDCEPGYFGIDCINECRFPNYGVNCQHICACSVLLCNKKTGCQPSTTGIKSQYSTNEINMWFNSVTTEDNHLKRKLSDANTTFSKFVYLTTLVSQENWSLQFSKTTSESTSQVPALSVGNKDKLFEINKPFIFGLVSGIVFLVIIMCVILCKIYHKSGSGTPSKEDIENQLKCMYYQRADKVDPMENNDQHNEITSATAPYETIDISSEDSELSELCSDISDTNNIQNSEMNTDEYLCPISEKCMKNITLESSDNSYLTVL